MKQKPTTETASKPKDVVEVPLRYVDDTEADAYAWALARPEVQAAVTIEMAACNRSYCNC